VIVIFFALLRNDSVGLAPGDCEKDEEGKRIMATLGRNMAFVLKKMHHPAAADITPP
jgi:hypothetical protein